MELKPVLIKFLEYLLEQKPLNANFTHNVIVNKFLTQFPFDEKGIEIQPDTRCTLQCSYLCEFPTFEHWVNKASSKIAGYPKSEVILCLDNEGYACNIGEDFMAARDNNRFPVKAYLVTRSVTAK